MIIDKHMLALLNILDDICNDCLQLDDNFIGVWAIVWYKGDHSLEKVPDTSWSQLLGEIPLTDVFNLSHWCAGIQHRNEHHTQGENIILKKSGIFLEFEKSSNLHFLFIDRLPFLAGILTFWSPVLLSYSMRVTASYSYEGLVAVALLFHETYRMIKTSCLSF